MAASTSSSAKPGKGRKRAVRTLVALGSVLAFLSIFSVWIERQLLNTDDWVATSGKMIEDPTIRGAVADYLVDELYANVDMEQELEEILPDAVSGLAGPAAGGLRQGAGQATERILENSTAQDLWKTANRAAHAELVTVLEGGDDRISTEGGVVTLDLGEMLRDLGQQIGVGANLTNQIPEDAARIVILRSDELETAQQVTQAIKGLTILLLVLTVLSFGLAVYLSRGQRWVALLSTAIGLIGAAFAVLIIRRIAGGIVVGELVTDPGVEPAAEAAWSIGTSLLTAIATTVIIFAVLLAVAAWLAAPAPSSRKVRELMAPGLRDHVAYFYGAVVVIAGLYLLISPSQSLRSFLIVLVIALLAALGIRELRKVTAAEFPDAPAWTGLATVRQQIGDSFGRLGARRAERQRTAHARRESAAATSTTRAQAAESAPPGPPAAPSSAAEASGADAAITPPPATAGSGAGGAAPAKAASSASSDRLEQLERLADLHQRGVLTDEELAREKARVLGEGGDLA